ncbi:hypothetical protein SCARD494_09387 [Seiridium cardinale]
MPVESGATQNMKRMRIGTKSCSECRRRKVRCIFSDEAKSCTSCHLHGTICKPQEPAATERGGSSPSQMEARLQKLESLLGQACEAAGISLDPSSVEASVLQLVDRLAISRRSDDAADSLDGSKGVYTAKELHQLECDQTFANISGLTAPLMEFMGESGNVLYQDCDVTTANNTSKHHNILKMYRENIEELLPSSSDLMKILESTQKFWALWPLHPTHLSPSRNLSVSVVTIANSFIRESIQSVEPSTMAKAVIWLVLCIQQFPRNGTSGILSTLPSTTELVFSYLEVIDALLDLDSRNENSRAGLDCLLLQAQCYVNMGRPRRAWLYVRRAMDQGMLLGLHEPRNRMEVEDEQVWAALWGYDSQLSLILGFPNAIPDTHIGKQDLSSTVTPECAIRYRINTLSGKINERNQKHQQFSYAATLMLDEELDEVCALFPACWWSLDATNQLPVEVFHARQSLKMYYFELKQLVHLPYMLKALTEKKYEYSRTSVLEALEGMIRCYGERRLHADGAYVMCFLVDFIAFSSGLILAADLISHKSLWPREIEEQKWALVVGLVSELKHAASLLDHTVANQAAQLLEYLYSARHGAYTGPEIYEATVPYFGKVRIRRPQPRNPATQQIVPDADCSVTWAPPSTVAFESNIFDFSPVPNPSELDVDWTSILNDHITYDWTGAFDF